MFRRGLLFSILATIVVVVMLVGGGMAIYRTGFAQGLATEFSGDTTELVSPWGSHPGFVPYHGRHFGFFPFGGLLGLLLFFMVASAIGRMIFFRRGRMACGPHPAAWKYWHEHPEAHKWGPPPWAKGWNAPEEGDDASSEEEEPTPQE
jgi:hypothetical protein